MPDIALHCIESCLLVETNHPKGYSYGNLVKCFHYIVCSWMAATAYPRLLWAKLRFGTKTSAWLAGTRTHR